MKHSRWTLAVTSPIIPSAASSASSLRWVGGGELNASTLKLTLVFSLNSAAHNRAQRFGGMVKKIMENYKTGETNIELSLKYHYGVPFYSWNVLYASAYMYYLIL